VTVALWIAGLAAYAAAGLAVSVEAAVRMRRVALGRTYTWQPDREDIFVLLGAGLFWPVTLAAYGWLRAYQWRKREFEKREAARG